MFEPICVRGATEAVDRVILFKFFFINSMYMYDTIHCHQKRNKLHLLRPLSKWWERVASGHLIPSGPRLYFHGQNMQEPAAAALGKAGSFDIILINECVAVVNLIVQFGSWWLEVLKFDINTFGELLQTALALLHITLFREGCLLQGPSLWNFAN